MARACTTKPFLQFRSGRPRPFPRMSGAVRDAFGSESEKANGSNGLAAAAEFPERFATRAKRSGGIAQAFAPPDFSAVFRSDSRGEIFWSERH